MTPSLMTGSGGYGGRVPSLGRAPAGADHHAAGAAAPDASRRLSLRLDPDLEAAGKARDALEQLEGELEDQVLEDMRLLVTELVTNSVRHAEADSAEGVLLEVSVGADRILLIVEDGGNGFAPLARTPDSPDDSGWGLHFVERMSSRWGVNANAGTRVWLELARRVR